MSSPSLQLIMQTLEASTSHVVTLFVGLLDHLALIHVNPRIAMPAEQLEERPVLSIDVAKPAADYLSVVLAHRFARRLLGEDELALHTGPTLVLNRDDHACLIHRGHIGVPSLCS